MSRRIVGILLLLVGSEIVGILSAERFYRLFLTTVPPAAVSSFSQSAAHAAFLLYGAGLGIVIFAWALLAAGVSRFFGHTSPASSRAAGATRIPSGDT